MPLSAPARGGWGQRRRSAPTGHGSPPNLGDMAIASRRIPLIWGMQVPAPPGAPCSSCRACPGPPSPPAAPAGADRGGGGGRPPAALLMWRAGPGSAAPGGAPACLPQGAGAGASWPPWPVRALVAARPPPGARGGLGGPGFCDCSGGRGPSRKPHRNQDFPLDSISVAPRWRLPFDFKQTSTPRAAAITERCPPLPRCVKPAPRSPPPPVPTMADVDRCCWICLGESGPLSQPCGCKARFVHVQCLAKWQLTSAGRE